MENNIYKKPVPKGIEASLVEKIDPISEPVWKHTITEKNKTSTYFQRFAEMSNSQLSHVLKECIKRWNTIWNQELIYMQKLEQIELEFENRKLKFPSIISDKLYKTRRIVNLTSFSNEEILLEIKKRSLADDNFYQQTFKTQAEIHNHKKQLNNEKNILLFL